MKTLFALILTALFGTPASANPPSANPRNPESPAAMTAVHVSASSLNPRLIVRLVKPEGRRAHLRLENAYGQSVFATHTRKADRIGSWALGLHELPTGTYHLVVSDYRYRPIHRQRVELTTTVVPDPQVRVVIP